MKKDNPSEISILMCTYKEDNPKYLAKALESLKEQSDFFYELIIVEDGILTAELKKIINKYNKSLKIKQISTNKILAFQVLLILD